MPKKKSDSLTIEEPSPKLKNFQLKYRYLAEKYFSEYA